MYRYVRRGDVLIRALDRGINAKRGLYGNGTKPFVNKWLEGRVFYKR